MKKEKIIMDGDWGGDEMQLATVLLAHTEQIEVIGATCTFGNVSHDNVYENAKRILHFLGKSHIPLYKGAHAPTGRNKPLLGDGAHPLITFLSESPNKKDESTEAVEFILDTLKKEDSQTVTITTCGPLTNIAHAILQGPQIMQKVKHIVIMGGCIEWMKAYDMYAVDGKRKGNITAFAEFNFQQAAYDAKVVLKSGLPITLLPMNCTHQLTFTSQRQKALVDLYSKEYIRRALVGEPYIQNEEIKPQDAYQRNLGLLNSPASWDAEKFHLDSVMHDIHCAFYILYPNEYIIEKGDIDVIIHDGILTSENMWYSNQGETKFENRDDSNIKVATSLKDTESENRLFEIFLKSISIIIPPTK